MNTFGLNKDYEQFNFEKIAIEDLSVISGGSGGGVWGFLIGYVGGKALDHVIQGLAHSAQNHTVIVVHGTTQYNGTHFVVPNSWV